MYIVLSKTDSESEQNNVKPSLVFTVKYLNGDLPHGAYASVAWETDKYAKYT